MSRSIDVHHPPAGVVLLDADRSRRVSLARRLRAAGFSVSAFATIAEMERWPMGAVVVTDERHFTPWWTRVGARRVFVLGSTPESGGRACARGACEWLPGCCTPEAVVQRVRRYCAPLDPGVTHGPSPPGTA